MYGNELEFVNSIQKIMFYCGFQCAKCILTFADTQISEDSVDSWGLLGLTGLRGVIEVHSFQVP